MVSIQAHSKFTVTPHRTALNLLVAPTPIIAPVIVCVVDTGIPICSVKNKVVAPAVSAQTPSSGVTLVILVPMVLMIFQPPLKVNIHLHTTKYVVSLLLHSFPVHEDL